MLGGQFFRHYWVILAFPIGTGLGALLGSVRAEWARAGFLSAALLVPLVSWSRAVTIPREAVGIRLSDDGRLVASEHVAEWFERNARPGDSLYVMCASAAVYGTSTHCVEEPAFENPLNVYGRTKLEGERRVAAFAAKGAPREAALLLAKLAVLDARGDFEGGRAALERATAIAPSLVFPQMLLAARYEAVGAWDSAVARYKRILETSPTDAAALNNLAYVLAVRKGDPEGALPYAKRAITAPDRGPEAIDTLAWVHHLLGNDAEALPMIAAAASQLPDSAEVRLHAAAILAAVGNLAASKDQLERAVTLDASLEAHPGVEALRLKLNLSK